MLVRRQSGDLAVRIAPPDRRYMLETGLIRFVSKVEAGCDFDFVGRGVRFGVVAPAGVDDGDGGVPMCHASGSSPCTSQSIETPSTFAIATILEKPGSLFLPTSML